MQNSVIQFHIAYKIMHDPVWWQVKDISGLIVADGGCISFRDIVLTLEYISSKSCVGCTTLCVGCTILGFSPSFSQQYSIRIKFRKDISIGNLRLSTLLPIVSSIQKNLDLSGLIGTIVFNYSYSLLLLWYFYRSFYNYTKQIFFQRTIPDS